MYQDGDDSGFVPSQNKYFPKEMFKTATNTSNAGTLSVYDDIIAKNELEHVLTQNESTVKLKYNEVIPLTEVVDMNKT